MEVDGDMTMGEMVKLIYESSSAGTKGRLDWAEINTTYNVEEGHYDCGTLDSRPSYRQGYADGEAAGKSGRMKLTNCGTSLTTNVSAFTSNWRNLTIDNFIIELTSLRWRLYNGNNSGSYSKSYNASTGTLSVSIPNVTSSNSYVYSEIRVWLIES